MSDFDRRVLRYVGLVAFIVFLILLVIGQPAPAVYLIIAGGMMGIDAVEALRRGGGK